MADNCRRHWLKMCGVNGIFAYHYAANPIDQDELVRTRDYMAKRGPDGKGAWVSNDRRVGFGHRRLSIIDLSDAGAQPMASADGMLVVTFNGEIYNYRELRRSLEGKGRVFRSQSDTEVLLHLYAEKGEAMVHELRGMFAFAIWNAEEKRLFLARDPYGIKPLYYADDGWTLRFASQVKALLAGGKVSRDAEPAGQVGFYLWGSVPEPFTTYRRSAPCQLGAPPWSIASAYTHRGAIILLQRSTAKPKHEVSARLAPKTVRVRSARLCLIACEPIWSPTCPSARFYRLASTPAPSSGSCVTPARAILRPSRSLLTNTGAEPMTRLRSQPK